MNNLCRGAWAEAVFDVYACSQLWEVSEPIYPCAYDRIINRGAGVFERVQIKKSVFRKGRSFGFVHWVPGGTSRRPRRYSASDFDWLAAVDVVGGAIWLIPWTAARAAKSGVSLSQHVLEYMVMQDWQAC